MKKDPRLSLLEDQIPHAAGRYIRHHIEQKRKRKAQTPSEREVQVAQDPNLKDATEEEVAKPMIEEMDEQGPERRAVAVIPSERSDRKKYEQLFRQKGGKKK